MMANLHQWASNYLCSAHMISFDVCATLIHQLYGQLKLLLDGLRFAVDEVVHHDDIVLPFIVRAGRRRHETAE